MRRHGIALLLILSGLPLSAQANRPSGEVSLGLSLQPDAVQDHGRGGYRFTLFPVGPIIGAAIRQRLHDGSSLGLRVDASAFLLGETSITGFSLPLDRPDDLVLVATALEWSASPAKRVPISLGAGVVHALIAPRLGRRTTPMVRAALSRRLTRRFDGRAGIDVSLQPIGRSWFQVPVMVSWH